MRCVYVCLQEIPDLGSKEGNFKVSDLILPNAIHTLLLYRKDYS